MSWNATVPATAPVDFDAAVDACETSPPEDGLAAEPKAQLAAARDATKALGEVIKPHVADGRLIAASLSGHACTEGDGGTDSINVGVREVPSA